MENQQNPSSNTPNPVQNRTLMAVLSYIGPLVIVSYVMGKHDPFVKFHIRQGLVLFSIEVLVWILASMLWSMWMIINILNIGTFILSVIGILNVMNNQEKELPVVGHLSNYFKI